MKRIWVRCAAAVLVLTALLAAAEVYLRVRYGAGHPVLVVADPACGYLFQPSQRVRRFGHRVAINRFGMRSSEVGPRQPNELRLLLVGDSVTYGTTRVDQQQIFAERLKTGLPPMLHRPVEVLNASASAWAIWNELGYVRSRGIFGSDVVLLVLNTGDLDQAPATLADLGEEAATNPPQLALEEAWERLVVARLHGRRQDSGTRVGIPSPEQERQNLDMLGAMRGYVEQHGGRFGIVFVPLRGLIEDGVSQSAPPALQQWAAQNHVPLLDVTAPLAALPIAEVSLDGFHLNPRGNAIVAATIEQHWAELTR